MRKSDRLGKRRNKEVEDEANRGSIRGGSQRVETDVREAKT